MYALSVAISFWVSTELAIWTGQADALAHARRNDVQYVPLLLYRHWCLHRAYALRGGTGCGVSQKRLRDEAVCNGGSGLDGERADRAGLCSMSIYECMYSGGRGAYCETERQDKQAVPSPETQQPVSAPQPTRIRHPDIRIFSFSNSPRSSPSRIVCPAGIT
jgi:hypothetical protein